MRILTLADIHIGSIKDTIYVYNVITDIIERELCFNKTDMIVILGDYFHRLFKVNEEFVSLSINIMSYIVRMCRKNNTKIRIIYGTESHEMNQYKLFNHHITSNDIDIKIIDTVCEERISKYINILYIPEEYVENKNEYYQKFFSKNYSYIFGHGIIDEGMPMTIYDTGAKSNEKKVPHFKSKELSSISKICAFGHYHKFVDMEDDCYYVGSLFRDSFGEEESKGYGIIEDDKFNFIENDKAYIYKTYLFNEDSDVYKSSDNIIKEIKKIKEDNNEIFSGESVGKIRFVFKLPIDIDSSFKENIRVLLFNEKNISILMKEDIINELTSNEQIESEYDFILDNSLNVIDKIHRYINKSYDIEMNMDELVKYITEEFKMT